MNKQELQNEINKTKEHLANMEKMLAECEYERWKPKTDEIYWYVDSRSGSACSHFCPTYKADADRYQNFNCFQTREQAEAEAEKILVRRQLEDIAKRLNKGVEINWKNEYQFKYGIYLRTTKDEIDWTRTINTKIQGVIYCLDLNFYNVAIQKIGEERLKKYLRGE